MFVHGTDAYPDKLSAHRRQQGVVYVGEENNAPTAYIEILF